MLSLILVERHLRHIFEFIGAILYDIFLSRLRIVRDFRRRGRTDMIGLKEAIYRNGEVGHSFVSLSRHCIAFSALQVNRFDCAHCSSSIDTSLDYFHFSIFS